jgi:hypothetical protein
MAKITTGYNYFGSYAIAICMGPVKTLHSIANGETIIFEGPIDSSSADSDGKTTLTTTIGNIDFYWGFDDQNVNAELDAVEIDYGSGSESVDMPAYRRVCYAVCHEIAFGQQVTPPTLQFDIVTETSGLSLSAHEADDDAIIPEVIYDYLVNALYGCGIDASHIETADLEAAAEILIAEDLAASPNIDSNETVRETLSRIVSHIDAVLFFAGGKVRFKLIRAEDTDDVPVITTADLLEEPRQRGSQWSETWNQTIVTYRDRENKWEEAPEVFTDPANAAILGHRIRREFNFPWFTRRGPAVATAKRLGITGGMPSGHWTLTLLPSWRTTNPGDIVKLTFAKLGITERILRVSDRRLNADMSVVLECYEERTRDTSNDYEPPEIPAPGTHNETPDIIDVTPRISWLPPDLLNDSGDGCLVVCNRTRADLTAAAPYFTWNESSPGYIAIQTEDSFPMKGTVLSWHQSGSGTWIFRVEMDTTHDLSRLQNRIAASGSDVLAVVGHRKIKTVGTPQDEHQVMSLWGRYLFGGRFEEITGRIIDIELSGAQFGTTDFSLEELATNGDFPTEHIYFGVIHDIYTLSDSWPSEWRFQRAGGNPVTSSTTDTDQKRYIKVPVANHREVQSAADVSAVWYDRNDTTMCPDGTFSRDWGNAAQTAYEVFNTAVLASLSASFADIDAALMAIFNGTATADQELLAAHIDEVLGSMLWNGHLYYNI